MDVRSPAAFVVSLLLLVASATLGVLVHDAEIGGPSAASLSSGDAIRIKGEATPFSGEAPADVESPSFWLDTDDWSGPILVTAAPLTPDGGVWVVEGEVVSVTTWHDGDLLVVDAADVTAPLVFD